VKSRRAEGGGGCVCVCEWVSECADLSVWVLVNLSESNYDNNHSEFTISILLSYLLHNTNNGNKIRRSKRGDYLNYNGIAGKHN
jgi:hypothetical protein